MERLAVYTSIDDKILTKVIRPTNTEFFILKIPQGTINLQRAILSSDRYHMKTEIWIEIGKPMLAFVTGIMEKALNVYSEDIVYESHIGV